MTKVLHTVPSLATLILPAFARVFIAVPAFPISIVMHW